MILFDCDGRTARGSPGNNLFPVRSKLVGRQTENEMPETTLSLWSLAVDLARSVRSKESELIAICVSRFLTSSLVTSLRFAPGPVRPSS